MAIIDKIEIIQRKKLEDSRGWFLKVITGTENGIPGHTGEVYLTSAKPNEAKGGHYHKKANEWFTLITGTCELKLVDMLNCETFSISLDASVAKTVYVPAGIAHIFVNKGNEDFILLAYSDELFDPVDTILFDKFNF
jgi:dTDP-4-dehydrorhamnose 3,5-epimerase-like enzyme